MSHFPGARLSSLHLSLDGDVTGDLQAVYSIFGKRAETTVIGKCEDISFGISTKPVVLLSEATSVHGCTSVHKRSYFLVT